MSNIYPQLQNKKFNEFESILGYSFNNINLLVQAMTHSSCKSEEASVADNELLEFLGDAVLELIISHILFESFASKYSEGVLTRMRASLVNETRLASLAKKLFFSHYIRLSKGEFNAKGYNKPSILADVFEAVIGAIYLDGGYERSLEVVRKIFMPQIEQIDPETPLNDYKSILQEHTQALYKTAPTYRVEASEGPDHDKKFTVALYLQDRFIVMASGKNKKEAEQRAAREAIAKLPAPGSS